MPENLVGRKTELNKLAIAHDSGKSRLISLYGMAGVGKTALALTFIDKLTSNYPDGRIYLEMRGTTNTPLSTPEAMKHVLQNYYPSARLPKNEAELHGLYHSVLHKKRAILLLDNAADAYQIAPLIPPAGCVLIITSRQHFTLPSLFSLRLDVLPPEDAQRYLLKSAPNINEFANEIAGLCGYLPLALLLVSRVFAEKPNLNPRKYLKELAKIPGRLKFIDSILSPSEKSGGIEASFNMSYELLDLEIRKLWCKLSIFQHAFDIKTATNLWNIELDLAQDTISKFMNHSLLEWLPRTRQYRLHDLLRLFANSHCQYEN